MGAAASLLLRKRASEISASYCAAYIYGREKRLAKSMLYASFYCLTEPDTNQVMVIKVWLVDPVGKEKVLKRFRY